MTNETPIFRKAYGMPEAQQREVENQKYDYELVYKKGSINKNADTLSRIKLNALETESLANNVDDEEIRKLLEDATEAEMLESDMEDLLKTLDLEYQNEKKKRKEK
ncbi:hypothetical protein HHI36_023891 [Cryptolaemus montrouzieri]|uniref:Uncharacterized protein n=1 Tax=Cryptolaemus montrouzieri TaxID=559131 RepID=A0ABD2MW51_9CUCU